MNALTVSDLIEILKEYPQDLPVAYDMCSEHCLLEKDAIEIVAACKPRPDGWVQRKRPDMEHQQYLMFPGS